MESLKLKLATYVAWLKQDKTRTSLIAIVFLLIAYNTNEDAVKTALNVVKVKTETAIEATAVPTAEEAAKSVVSSIKSASNLDGQVCEETDVKAIIKADGYLDTSKYIVLDLNTFKVTKTKEMAGKIYTYYVRYGAVDEYYTVAAEKPKGFIKVESK